MKKGIFIALCSIAIALAGCTKPDQPTPEPVDYAANYTGSYVGQFTLTITSMNHQQQSGLAFPIDGIGMDIAKGSEFNSLTATVKVDNESRQSQGTATEEKADFEAVHLLIDKPDQNYSFNLDLKMEGSKNESDTLNIIGSFTGDGKASFPTPQGMMEQIFDEVSGTIKGKLVKQ